MHRWLATVKTIAQCLTYMYVLVNNIWELVMVDLGAPHVLQLILTAQLFRSGCLLCLFPVLITTVLSINSSALSVCCATQSVPTVIPGLCIVSSCFCVTFVHILCMLLLDHCFLSLFDHSAIYALMRYALMCYGSVIFSYLCLLVLLVLLLFFPFLPNFLCIWFGMLWVVCVCFLFLQWCCELTFTPVKQCYLMPWVEFTFAP